MTAAVGNQSVAGLQAQAQSLAGQLTAGGVNVAGILGTGAAGLIGGGTTPGVATGAAGANAGITTTQAVSARGATVTVMKDNAKGIYTIAPTGQDEMLQIDGKVLRFNAQGKSVTNFDVVKREPIAVNIDNREGVAAGISNLSRVVASRQERVKKLTEAAAADSNENGTINQIDMQLIVQEQATNDHMNGLNKKIFDGVEESISLWLR